MLTQVALISLCVVRHCWRECPPTVLDDTDPGSLWLSSPAQRHKPNKISTGHQGVYLVSTITSSTVTAHENANGFYREYFMKIK